MGDGDGDGEDLLWNFRVFVGDLGVLELGICVLFSSSDFLGGVGREEGLVDMLMTVALLGFLSMKMLRMAETKTCPQFSIKSEK